MNFFDRTSSAFKMADTFEDSVVLESAVVNAIMIASDLDELIDIRDALVAMTRKASHPVVVRSMLDKVDSRILDWHYAYEEA